MFLVVFLYLKNFMYPVELYSEMAFFLLMI